MRKLMVVVGLMMLMVPVEASAKRAYPAFFGGYYGAWGGGGDGYHPDSLHDFMSNQALGARLGFEVWFPGTYLVLRAHAIVACDFFMPLGKNLALGVGAAAGFDFSRGQNQARLWLGWQGTMIGVDPPYHRYRNDGLLLSIDTMLFERGRVRCFFEFGGVVATGKFKTDGEIIYQGRLTNLLTGEVDEVVAVAEGIQPYFFVSLSFVIW